MKTIKTGLLVMVLVMFVAAGCVPAPAPAPTCPPCPECPAVDAPDPMKAVRERISIEASEDVFLKNGADLYMYSDNRSTQEFHVDGATGTVTMAGAMKYTATAWTPTAGETLTAAATYYTVNSSAAVTITLGTTGAAAGQLLILVGDDANTVTINDTNLLSADGNAIDFGQYDVVMLVFNGTKWALIAKSANS